MEILSIYIVLNSFFSTSSRKSVIAYLYNLCMSY